MSPLFVTTAIHHHQTILPPTLSLQRGFTKTVCQILMTLHPMTATVMTCPNSASASPTISLMTRSLITIHRCFTILNQNQQSPSILHHLSLRMHLSLQRGFTMLVPCRISQMMHQRSRLSPSLSTIPKTIIHGVPIVYTRQPFLQTRYLYSLLSPNLLTLTTVTTTSSLLTASFNPLIMQSLMVMMIKQA
jgi:hypothetical protein